MGSDAVTVTFLLFVFFSLRKIKEWLIYCSHLFVPSVSKLYKPTILALNTCYIHFNNNNNDDDVDVKNSE